MPPVDVTIDLTDLVERLRSALGGARGPLPAVAATFPSREEAVLAALDAVRGLDPKGARVVIGLDVATAGAWRLALGLDREASRAAVEVVATGAVIAGLAVPEGVGLWRAPRLPHHHGPDVHLFADYR